MSQPTEIASLLAVADADVSPLDQKLGGMETRVRQSADRIERAYANVGSKAFGGFDQAVTRITMRIPVVGGALAQVEQRAFGVRQAFVAAGEAQATAWRSAQKEVDSLTQKLAAARAAARQAVSDFGSKVEIQFGGMMDLPFLRQFRQKDFGTRMEMLSDRGLSGQWMKQTETAALQLEKLERDGARSVQAVEDKLAEATKAASAMETGVEGLSSAGVGLAGTLAAVGVAVGVVIAALTVAAVLVAGTAAGLFQMASSAADAADKYYDLGQQVNVSAHTLSALDVMAAQSGATWESVGSSLGIFDKKLEEAGEKSTKLGRVLRANSVDTRDNQKALEGMFQILSKLPEGQTQTALAMEAFGRGGKAMLGIIKQAQGDLPTAIRLLDQMGATISDKDAQAANDFNDKLEVLKRQFDAVKVKIGSELFPVFENLFDSLSKWLAENQGAIRSWGGVFLGVADALIAKAGEVKTAFEAVLSVWNSIQSLSPGSASDVHQTPGVFGSAKQTFDNFVRGANDLEDRLFGPRNRGGDSGGFGYDTRSQMVSPEEAAEEGRRAREDREAHERAERAYQAYLDRVKREKEAAARRVSGLLGEKSGGGHKGGDSKALAAARDEIAGLEIVRQAEERIYQQRTQDEQYYYQNSLKGLDAYVQMRHTLEDEHLKQELAVAEKELQIAQAIPGNSQKKQNEVAKAEEKINAIYARAQAANTEIDRQAYLAQTQAMKQAWDAKVSLLQVTASGFESVYNSLAERGVMTFRAAQDRIAAAQREILLAQKKGIERQLTRVSPDSLAGAGLKAQLDEIIQTIANFDAETVESGIGSDRKDYQRRQDTLSQIRDFGRQVVDSEQAMQEERLSLLERAGVSRETLWRKELAFELEAERVRSERVKEDLQTQRDYVEKWVAAEQGREDILKAIDARIAEEDRVTARKRSLIWEEFYAKQNDRLKELAERAVSILDDGLKALRTDGFKGLFKAIGEDFLDLLVKMEEDLLKSKLLGLLRQITHTPAPGSTTGDPSVRQAATKGLDFGVLGTVLNKVFHVGGSSPTADAAAVSSAGHEATEAIKGGWNDSVAQIGKAGDKQAGALTSVGQSIVSSMLSVASIIAAGAGQGSFWKGLLGAAAIGFVSGLANGLMKPKDSGGGGGSSHEAGHSGAAAAGGLIGARAGGRLVLAGEAGYDEVILSTDPKHRDRTSQLLAAFVARTGIAPAFAAGGFTSGYVPPAFPAHHYAQSGAGGGITVKELRVEVKADGEMSDKQARRTGRQVARATRGALAQFN